MYITPGYSRSHDTPSGDIQTPTNQNLTTSLPINVVVCIYYQKATKNRGGIYMAVSSAGIYVLYDLINFADDLLLGVVGRISSSHGQ